MKNTPNSLNMTLTSPNYGVVMVKSGFKLLVKIVILYVIDYTLLV